MTDLETCISKLSDAKTVSQEVLDAWRGFAESGKRRSSDADFENYITVVSDAATRALALIQEREAELEAR